MTRGRIGRVWDGRTYDAYPFRPTIDVPNKSNCAAFAETFLNTFHGLARQTPLVQSALRT